MTEVMELLVQAIERNASDILLTVGLPPVFKINGTMVRHESEALTPDMAEAMIRRLFIRESIYRDFVENGEKDFSFSLARKGRFRVNAYLQRGSYAAAIRVVRIGLPDPVKLGIPDTVLDFYRKNKGLILVTGPTGCGKTTTLAAMVDRINRKRECHVITLEDPVEYLHHHDRSVIEQREIGADSKTFASGLRAALRQAPDVILVGEMRDLETISIALTAAETGHLVLSSLHTIGAAKTIDRIIDVFSPSQQQQVRVQLSTVLQAVISQQLLPSVDGGLVPAFEIMIANSAIRNMIRESRIPQIDTAMQTGRNQGMVTMDMSLAELCRCGRISRDDALTYCVSPETLSRYLDAGTEE